ncbi:uncharacterized protein LOC108913306 [Anoplophora glabripennis]|uniref:uncharacterized protein LOC108913306 n=1 Tax=Anoplophora glabripennis TaxID=217634 RepID=UPI0008735012|nr:uncharacterized protein LOC108913306 [Anoplophora glabripennis]
MANKNKCKECGCTCKRCISTDHDVQLHVEIENLKQRLVEKETHIVTMETNFLNEANRFPSGELVAVREELLTWQDKYKRLYEAHRRVQRVNQGLEDKLLKLVDACETEKNALTKDVATLSHKLAEANYAIKKLTDDNERYKNDVSLAIQFLQCKQSNFVAHKFDSLPPEVQSQVSNYMTHKKKPEERKAVSEAKSIKVPIPTFPPTAMVYSVPKSPRPEKKIEPDVEAPSVDIVSAAIMAKVLEERQKEKALAKHCDTCTCSKNLRIIYEDTHHSIGSQTGDYCEMLCLRCNENVQFTSVGMKIVRSSDFKNNKNVPTSLETVDLTPGVNNIVKVQPNNFLNDTKSSTNSNVSPKNSVINPNNHVISNELRVYQDGSETEPETDQQLQESPPKTPQEKADPEHTDKDPKNCSAPLQSATRNILLDNAHNNIAPVLYTQSHKMKFEGKPQTKASGVDPASSAVTPVVYTKRIHKIKTEAVQTHDLGSISSGDFKSNSISSDASMRNQQRVAEWIQNNLDNDVSSSDNSRADSVKNRGVGELDKVKYAEMEKNVKRFLFGESEFLKTVEIGKMKYQSLQDGPSDSLSKKSSCTETDI